MADKEKLLLVTHPHIDMDAASSMCAAMLKRNLTPAQVGRVYLGANIPQLPDLSEVADEVLVLDHPLGLKGVKSCLDEMKESRDYFSDEFIAEVNEQDSSGKSTPRHPLSRIFGAIRYSLRETLEGGDVDEALLSIWYHVCRGLSMQERQKREALKTLDMIPIETTGPYRWACSEGPMPPQTGELLNNLRNVTGFVYFEKGSGLGVFRFPGQNQPDLNLLHEHLPGWFIHPTGFLACWGSRKAPAVGLPPTGTPQNQAQLLALLHQVFDAKNPGELA